MKILTCYYSSTGNTEKVAKAIHEGLGADSTLVPIKDADPASLKDYDLVVLGSGIYGGKFHKDVISFMKAAGENLAPKFALFCTHNSPKVSEKGLKRLIGSIEKAGSELLGMWDCAAPNLGMSAEAIAAMMKNMPEDQRKQAEAYNERIKNKPDAEDLENAKAFGKSLI